MTTWKGPAAWAGHEASAGDRLPYQALLDDGSLLLRDGSLLRTIHVAGLAFETEDSEALNHRLAVREVMLRSALDARHVVYHHVIRRRIQPELTARFDSPLAGLIDRRWQERLSDRRLFINEQFLTILRRPARGKAGLVDRILSRGRSAQRLDSERRALDAAVTALLAGLEPYGARALGTYDTVHGLCSEVLELLSALYNGEMRPVLMPPQGTDIGRHIPYSRVSFGVDALELAGPQGRQVAAGLSVKEYPDATRAGLLDNILRLPVELTLTESFAPVDRQTARERMDLALRRHRATDEETMTERAEMLAARDALSAGQVGFGDHHLGLLVRADDLTSLDDAIALAGAALSDIGAIAVREDVNLEPLFWGQFPGNERFLVRRALISTANAAGFLSLHGFPLGSAGGNHWGDAVAMFETTSATPYFFNFHEGDLGNFTIIGPSGSGKTVVLNFLAAQAQKFKPRTIFFDKDRGAEIFLRGIGGHYSRLLPGQPSSMNPLQLPDNAVNRAFLRLWLACLLKADGPQEEAAIADAVDACFDHAPHLRRLRHFRELLSGATRPTPGDLASRLSPWIGLGEHAWLFDNEVDRLDLEARVLGFDMTALLEVPALRTPAMMYLFHRIDERLDGDPSMILIDEGWKALDDPVFAARIRDWLKTLRKRNAIVGFATQSARDALDSRIASAIVEQTATMIFMPNPKARDDDYCAGFGLSAHELELIRGLPAHGRCFLVRHANHSIVPRLDLGGMNDMLMVLSGREANVRRLDMIRASTGDDPARWYPRLTGTPWPGATDLPPVERMAAE